MRQTCVPIETHQRLRGLIVHFGIIIVVKFGQRLIEEFARGFRFQTARVPRPEPGAVSLHPSAIFGANFRASLRKPRLIPFLIAVSQVSFCKYDSFLQSLYGRLAPKQSASAHGG